MTFSCDSNPANIYFLKEQKKILETKNGKFSFCHYEGLSPNREGWLFPKEEEFSDSSKLSEYLKTLLTIDSTPRFILLTEEQKNMLETCVNKHFPDLKITFGCNEGDQDYIYSIKNMASLPGKTFQKKRNHISRFKRTYGETLCFKLFVSGNSESLEREIFPQIQNIYLNWKKSHSQSDNDFLSAEEKSIKLSIQEFNRLKLIAGVLYVEQIPAAFIIASFTTPEYLNAHFEKCLDEYAANGAPAYLNQQFAQAILQQFPDCKYLNREEDLNVAGLRKSKLSYQPVAFIKKYYGTITKER